MVVLGGVAVSYERGTPVSSAKGMRSGGKGLGRGTADVVSWRHRTPPPPLRLLFGHVAPLVYEVMSLRVVKEVVKALLAVSYATRNVFVLLLFGEYC